MSRIQPLTLEFPTTIKTERLIIRAPQIGDGPALNQGLRESQEALRKWMAWAKVIPTVEESEQLIRSWVGKFTLREDLPLLLWHGETGEFIGASGLHSLNWSVPRMEIGYWLHSQHTGKGYMTEAVNAITDFAFTHLYAERLEIRCDSRNRASASVAERAGYTLEGCLKRQMRDADGDLRDTLVYARLRPEA